MCWSPILRLHAGTRTRIHTDTRIHTRGTASSPVTVSELETPSKWCANQGALSSSGCIMQLLPWFTVPFSPFLSPSLFLASLPSRLFCCHGQICWYRFIIHAPFVMTSMIASFLKTGLCSRRKLPLENYLKVNIKLLQESIYWVGQTKLKIKSRFL